MNRQEFTVAALERLFVRGFDCSNHKRIEDCVLTREAWMRPAPDPDAFASWYAEEPGLAVPFVVMATGATPSLTAGANNLCLALHEAGHAVVALAEGLAVYGVRFFGDYGSSGETGVRSFPWENSTDEEAIRRAIRVDVAANLAEMTCSECEPAGGLPSCFLDDKDPTIPMQAPTDIISAWGRAHRLATLRFSRAGERKLPPDAMRQAKREIVEQAEVDAQHILQANLEALNRLAERLQSGPMTGAQVRALVGTLSRPAAAEQRAPAEKN
jgi:hypothetical protein